MLGAFPSLCKPIPNRQQTTPTPACAHYIWLRPWFWTFNYIYSFHQDRFLNHGLFMASFLYSPLDWTLIFYVSLLCCHRSFSMDMAAYTFLNSPACWISSRLLGFWTFCALDTGKHYTWDKVQTFRAENILYQQHQQKASLWTQVGLCIGL